MRLASLCMVLGLLQLDVHLHWGLDADDLQVPVIGPPGTIDVPELLDDDDLADGLGFRPRSDLT
jgi:hypothetical protein